VTIASDLASAINGTSSSPVTAASGSGGVVTLTSKATGTAANYPNLSVSVIDTGSDPALFPSPSFSGTTSGAMTGGQNGILYDSGAITLTVNGHSDSASFGKGSSTSSIAAALTSTVNADSGAAVTATASGATVSLKTKQAGSTVNYSLSASDSYDSGDFSQSSFTASTSGGSLTGGSNSSGPDIYDSGTVKLTIDGTTESASYGKGSTGSSVASSLAGAFSGNSDVNVQASGANLTLTAYATGSGTDYSYSFTSSYDSGDFTSASFSGSPASGSLTGGADAPSGLYSYSIPASGGYAPNGNVTAYTDSVMGSWSLGYDHLNRLTSASVTSGAGAGLYGCWSYDNFGNRTAESIPMATACPGTESDLTPTARYNALNRVTWTSVNAAVNGFSYDAAGNVLNDNANAYLYDGEGRLCAVGNLTTGGMVEYIYNAEGERVIKGTIATFNCNPASNGFTVTNVYVRGLNGEELTETNGSLQWDHTNVFADGELLATYKGTETYFALNDWLGTKRGEATPDGKLATYITLPYGNDLTASGSIPDATEQHFTGKEHDSESGNDYFGARYYSKFNGAFLIARLERQG